MTNSPVIIRIALLLALSLGLAGVLWFGFKDDKDNAKKPPPPKATKTSDYAMTNFKLTIMDSDGKPTRIMYGDRLIHYADDDSSHVIQQKTEVLSDNDTLWVISSDTGDTQGSGEDIVLNGNVKVKSEPDKGTALYTSKLYLNTVANTAYTDKPVTIKTPDGGNTNGVGMDAKLQDKIINLHSKVIGYHDSPFSD